MSKHRIHDTQVDSFTWGYITALFWTTSEYEFPEYCYSGEFSISKEDADRLTGDALIKVIDDCSKFYDAIATNGIDRDWLTCNDYQLGHDFALSRNGHGAGFFDRNYASQEILDTLQALARSYGEVNLFKLDCNCYEELGDSQECECGNETKIEVG